MSSRKRTPDQESTETPAAVAEPPAAEAKSFAERVGPRKSVAQPDPFGIGTDPQAGIRFFDSKRDGQVAIKFAEKPSEAVIAKVKEAGYHWQPADQIWAHRYGDNPTTARIESERLYQELRQMIRQEKGIEAGPEVPF
jgi:hypothetical protein